MTFPLGSSDSYYQQLKRNDYHKPHVLHFSKNEPFVRAEKSQPGHEGTTRVEHIKREDSIFPTDTHGTVKPQWLVMDKVILRFYSYSHEGALEDRKEEKMRIRYFEIQFFLEDDTIMIMEQLDPRAEMDTMEGKLLNRQRVPRHKDPMQHMTVHDLNVQKPAVIFGRLHFIYKCDPFTRETLTKMGITVEPDEAAPYSQHALDSESERHMNHRLRRYVSLNHHMERFLKHDTEVLRFFAYWDDRETLFGERHFLVIHYFLADQTTEILRKTQQAYGKEKLEFFVRRCKLPKNTEDLKNVNLGAPWPVLNIMCVNAKRPETWRVLFDQAQFDKSPEIFTEVDFKCGEVVNVLGRPIFLYGCDGYTQWYYKEIYGIDMKTIDVEESKPFKQVIKPPPYNEYGSEEDSLRNCAMLVPKPPLLDVRKYLLLDWEKSDPSKLIFRLKMVTDNKRDAERKFVMSFSLSDDGIFVYEKNVPPGATPGTYRGNRAMKKMNDPATDQPVYVTAEDLYVGAVFEFSKRTFVITEVDDCTAKFFERYPDRFPFANAPRVLDKFRRMLRTVSAGERYDMKNKLENCDPSHTGFTDWTTFVSILAETAATKLTPHEYLTMARYYQYHTPADKEKMKQLAIALVQHGFRHESFDAGGNFRRACIRADPDAINSLTRSEFIRCMKAVRAPVNYELLDIYLDVVANADQMVPYESAIQDFDYISRPAKALEDIPLKVTRNFDFVKYFGDFVPHVNYRNFLLDIKDYLR